MYICCKCYRKNRPVRKSDWPPSQRYYNCLSSCIFSSAEPLVCVKWLCTLIQCVSLFYFAVIGYRVSTTSHINSHNSVVALLFRVVPAFFFFQSRAKQASRAKEMKRCFQVGNKNRPSREGNIQYDGEKWRKTKTHIYNADLEKGFLRPAESCVFGIY